MTLVLLLAAALMPGAAVSRAHACSYAPLDVLTKTEMSETIVVAEAVTVSETRAEFAPEVFLKGAVTAGHLALTTDPAPDGAYSSCSLAEFHSGGRYILFLNGASWPFSNDVMTLANGQALLLGTTVGTEDEVVAEIQGVTEQYAVAAQTDAESQGVEWWKTVVPVAAAVLGIFVVGLFLMRIWHRIDPS